MKTGKIFVLVVLALALAMPMTALAQDGKQQVSLWFHSGQGSERDALAELIDQFNAQSDEYEVVPLEVPEGSYNDQVKAAALAGDLPCVLDFDGPFVYNYVFSGDLIPLDDYASEELLADDEVRAALSEDEINEKFDLGYHTKHVDTIFARVFGED